MRVFDNPASRQPPRPPLSPRQLEIALLVAQGLPTKTIGATLHISPWTVATHLRRLYLRFGVSTRAAMIARLMDKGLLQVPNP